MTYPKTPNGPSPNPIPVLYILHILWMAMSKNVLFMGANGFPAKVYAPVGVLLGEALGRRGTDLKWRPFDYHGGLRQVRARGRG